jgi:hypothetical protein
MASQTTSRHRQQPLKPLAWTEINEPGAYVEVSTGTLYRIPPQALAEGTEPMVEKQTESGPQLVRVDWRPLFRSKFVRVSDNPDIFLLGARMICIQHDIRPRF